MLNHLAQCAECREIAAFALPAEAAGAEPARVTAGRRWSPWPVLRWGAMAAVLGTLAVVVVLHPGTWNRHLEISKETHPRSAGTITSAPSTLPAPPSAQPPLEPARAKAKVDAREIRRRDRGSRESAGAQARSSPGKPVRGRPRQAANGDHRFIPATRGRAGYEYSHRER